MIKTDFVIALDVDITLCPSGEAWLSWLEGVCQTKLNLYGTAVLDYNLTKYFKEELAYQGLTGFEFWNHSNLYDKLLPVEGSVAALESLYNQGHTLVALSAHMGAHAASKRDWVYRHYPFVEDVILVDKAASKSYIKCDAIVEDRPENLEGFYGVFKYVIDSPYLEKDYKGKVYKDWPSIAKAIENDYNDKVHDRGGWIDD